MRFYRYMSKEEFVLLLNGQEIVGRCAAKEGVTSSNGVCFFASNVKCKETGDGTIGSGPATGFSIIEPIMEHDSVSVLVEFKANVKLNKSNGIYGGTYFFRQDNNLPERNKFSSDWWMVQEYCLPSYSRMEMKPIRFKLKKELGFSDSNWVRI